jgi:molecular chaperone HtpG
MRDNNAEDLADFVGRITTLSVADGAWPDRFFEVELSGVVRQGDDRLLRPETVSDYLAQVAPVGLSEDFSLRSEIQHFLEPYSQGTKLEITVNESEPIVRPHRDETPAGEKGPIALRELQTFEIPGLDGGVAAVGWIAHHDYDGAIPTGALIKGLRVRIGGIQIGGSALLEDVFPETRFSSWTVGEVNLIDPRIVPNGRRDNFEQNGHLANLLNHLSPIARDIARRCRDSSADRQRRRNFELQAAGVEQQLGVLEQGALADSAHATMTASASQALTRLEKFAGGGQPDDSLGDAMSRRASLLRLRLDAVCSGEEERPSPLDDMDPARREAYQEVIGLIYQCSTNQVSAKQLVDRIIERLG